MRKKRYLKHDISGSDYRNCYCFVVYFYRFFVGGVL